MGGGGKDFPLRSPVNGPDYPETYVKPLPYGPTSPRLRADDSRYWLPRRLLRPTSGPPTPDTSTTLPDPPYGKRLFLRRSRYIRLTFHRGSIPSQNRVFHPGSLRLTPWQPDNESSRSKKRNRNRNDLRRLLPFRPEFFFLSFLFVMARK